MRMCQEGEKAMNSSWRFFVVVEALLLLFAVWQIVMRMCQEGERAMNSSWRFLW